MTRSWMGVASMLAGLAVALPVSAQQMPEPVPFAPSSVPSNTAPMLPGPLPPEAAPAGPPPELTLPANLPGAFMREPPPIDCGWYFYAGTQALQRQHLGHGPVAVIDRVNRNSLENGALPRTSRFVSPVLTYDDVTPKMAFGVTATLGYYSDNYAIEATGFYIPQNSSSATATMPGRQLLFFNPTPLGFEGNNGLWRQADQTRVSLESSLGSAELNYRWWNRGVDAFEPMIGIRYVDSMERVSIFTDDEGIRIRDINNLPDPRRQATYSLRAQNRIIAAQLGCEFNKHFFSHFSLGLMAKGAWGWDFVNVERDLYRGDGFAARTGARNDSHFSHVYELGVHVDFYFIERMRLRAGYNCLWLVDVTEAVDQVSFNLRNRSGTIDDHGSILYHGPTIQLQFLF